MTEEAGEKQKQFMSLFDPVNERLSRYIQSVVWNEEDAKDIMGETVLIAYQNLDKLREKNVFIYYLFGIASRLIKQRERKKMLWQIFSRNNVQTEQDHSTNPEAKIDLEVFYKALQQLNLKEREAIVMYEISGFSIKEIQEVQKDSLSAVKSRLSRAREKLAKIMEIDQINKSRKSSAKADKNLENEAENNKSAATDKPNSFQLTTIINPYGDAGKA